MIFPIYIFVRIKKKCTQKRIYVMNFQRKSFLVFTFSMSNIFCCGRIPKRHFLCHFTKTTCWFVRAYFRIKHSFRCPGKFLMLCRIPKRHPEVIVFPPLCLRSVKKSVLQKIRWGGENTLSTKKSVPQKMLEKK